MTRAARIQLAYEKDPEILCDKSQVDNNLGHNPDYLLDIHGITKADLIRLERLGLAMKARYETRHPKAGLYESAYKQGLSPTQYVCKTGTHRVRWLIFKGAENA